MKRLFSFSLYLQGLKRILTAGGALAVTVAVLAFLNGINQHPDICFSELNPTPVYKVYEHHFMFTSLLMLFAAPVLNYHMFSFLNKRSSADLYHSLPYKRTTVYVSYVLALFTWIFGILLVDWGVSVFTFGAVRGFVIDSSVLWGRLWFYASSVLALSGATVFAVTLTGRALSAAYTAGILIILPLWLTLMIETMLCRFYPCLDLSHGIFKYVGSQNSIYSRIWDGENPLSAILLYTLMGFLWLTLGGFGYARRKSETAGRSASSSVSRGFIRGILSFLLFLGASSSFITTSNLGKSVSLCMSGVVVAFVYDLLVTKSVKHALKAMPRLLAAFALSGMVVGASYLAGTAMRANDAQCADEVESLTIVSPHYYFSSGVYIDTPVENLTDGAVIEWVLDSIREQTRPTRGYEGTKVLIRLKNGKELWRFVELNQDGDGVFEELALRTPELNERARPLPKVSRFPSEKDEELWEIYKEEYYSLPFARRTLSKMAPNGGLTFAVLIENLNGDELVRLVVATKDDTPRAYEYAVNNRLWVEWTGSDD